MLHGICRYAVAVFIRWANRGQGASCFVFEEFWLVISGILFTICDDYFLFFGHGLNICM